VSKGLHTSSRLELFILDNGKVDSGMDLENKRGLMVQSTQENGEKIEPMEKEDSFTLMAIFMMDIGLTIKPTVVVFINTLTVLSMKVSGRMTSNMVMALRHGQTNQNMKETMLLAVNME
jgi:hypothetical protein